MELEEVVGVELVVGKVADETIESVLPGPKKLLRKLPIGSSCLRSHTASARGTGVGCRDMMRNSGRCSARLQGGMRGEWGV